jgi:hypothetical protein
MRAAASRTPGATPRTWASICGSMVTWLASVMQMRKRRAERAAMNFRAPSASRRTQASASRTVGISASARGVYPRAAAAFEAAGGSVLHVPVDSQGMQVGHAFAGPAPAVLHLTAAHQYPSGVRLSGVRRAELARLVTRRGSLLIENEYDHEFIHEGQNHAALAGSLPAHGQAKAGQEAGTATAH